MSRSYAASEDGYSRYAPSSPLSYGGDDFQSADPSVRHMRLKVLYTTDDKTNCMARWPKAVQIRTAYLDEQTEIGVVELRTCVKAIVTSSPELVAKLGHDYTVYAYDYSECEVPLVGQGMLSWALASTSSTSSQSGGMVTGRVTQNANALFGRDAIAQTLEVKLRLVPVPTISQSEYIESMRKYRDISRVMPENFDAQGWTEFLQANPQVLSLVRNTGHMSPQGNTSSIVGLDQVQRLMQSGNSYNAPLQPGHSRRGSLAESMISRDASPTPSVQSAFTDAQTDQLHRPLSQASHRELRRTASTGQIVSFEYENKDDAFEDGPARKRARITQIRRPGKNAGFGKQVDSLRVAASTANSVRVLQPTAMRPGMDASSEGPPRAPTPVPQTLGHGPRRLISQSRSGLGRFSTSTSGAERGAHFQEQVAMSRSAAASPDDHSVLESSPGEDPGSSPPVPIENIRTVVPSSPQLPRLPVHEDSGFMSGTVDESLDIHGKQPRPSIESQLSVLNSDIQSQTSDIQQPKPRRLAAKLPRADSTASFLTAEEQASETSRKNALRAIGWRRVQSFSEGQTEGTTATAPSLEKSKQKRRLDEDQPKAKHPYDKDKQKERMHHRLMNALAAGERPPMCENCGSLQSQTWRKAYKRQYSGSPDGVKTGKGPGAILTVIIDERDQNGEISLFSIVKKSLATDDRDFEDMLLCNPCGLWLSSKGDMRPPRVFNQTKNGQPRSKVPSATYSSTRHEAFAHARSLTVAPSEATEPPSEPPLAPFQSQFGEDGNTDLSRMEREHSNGQNQDAEPELPVLPEARQSGTGNTSKHRSDSAIPAIDITALQRATQSSPSQSRGSRHSPIEVDTTPDRTRRTLFPSPKTKGPLALSAGNKSNTLRDSPDAPKQYRRDLDAGDIGLQDGADKENLMPPPPRREQSRARTTTPIPPEEHDVFSDVFKDSIAPSTPSPNNGITLPFPKSPSNTFKTPTKATPTKAGGLGNFFSSAEKAFLHGNPTTPTRTPSRTSARGTPGSVNDTPFTRQLKSLFSADPAPFEMDTSPSKVFGDLPTFDDFTDWPMTTDMPMPSSPPVMKNDYLLKTPGQRRTDEEDGSPSWDELGLGKTPGMPGQGMEGEHVTVFHE